jgi:uncharacterized protein (TIGR02118 family)
MVKLVLLFRQPAKPGTFELRYLHHQTLLRKMPGVQKIQTSNVLGGPAGKTDYFRSVDVFFEDFEALDRALRSPEGVAAGKDLMDFSAHRVELLFVEERNSLSPQPLSPVDLEAYLKENEIDAEIVYPGEPTPTVAKAAQAMKVDENQIVKTLLFLVDERPFLVYACGTGKVDPGKLATRLSVSSEQVKFASPEQVQDITGYAVHTVPPIGLKTPMPAYMDPAVRQYDVIYAGGGGDNALLKISSETLQRLSRADLLAVLSDTP